MRERIGSLALDLLIQHGYRGVSFGVLAKSLGTTRANIHYHFGNKESLVEEVLEDYVEATLAALKGVWTAPDKTFTGKIDAMVDYSRKRYMKYNSASKKGRPWSLIARMRQDSDVLTTKGRNALQRFGRELQHCIAKRNRRCQSPQGTERQNPGRRCRSATREHRQQRRADYPGCGGFRPAGTALRGIHPDSDGRVRA